MPTYMYVFSYIQLCKSAQYNTYVYVCIYVFKTKKLSLLKKILQLQKYSNIN